MDLDERTTYLYGQIDALKTMCMALLHHHPDPSGLLETLEHFSEVAVAKNTATIAPDIALDATQSLIDDFRKILRIAVETPTHPDTPSDTWRR